MSLGLLVALLVGVGVGRGSDDPRGKTAAATTRTTAEDGKYLPATAANVERLVADWVGSPEWFDSVEPLTDGSALPAGAAVDPDLSNWWEVRACAGGDLYIYVANPYAGDIYAGNPAVAVGVRRLLLGVPRIRHRKPGQQSPVRKGLTRGQGAGRRRRR